MKVLVLFVALFSSVAFADTMKVQIDRFDYGKTENDPDLVLFSNGRVGFIHGQNKLDVLSELRDIKKTDGHVEVTLGDDFEILSIAPAAADFEMPKVKMSSIKDDFVPTVLPNMNHAYNIFNRMNSRYQQESQCYNRAHVWAYEENRRSNLKSQKLFIFFTTRYIRTYNYKWWFHVVPAVLVNEGSVNLKAIDYTFANGPRSTKVWSDIFIKSKRVCPMVSRYSQYSTRQEAEDCYLMLGSMYFWQPRDLEAQENTGAVKTSFIQWEVDWAYDEAF